MMATSKYRKGQAVSVQHRRTGRFIVGIVSQVMVVDRNGRVEPYILGGQPQYRVDIGGTNLQAGEDQIKAL